MPPQLKSPDFQAISLIPFSGLFGIRIALVTPQTNRKGGKGFMKIVMSLAPTLLLIGTTLLARAQAQGFESALFATAMEFGLNGARYAIKRMPYAMQLNR